ncbi:MAG TPA: SAM-dependent methyltransferase [Xanthomonadaceae bacterium]|nr:SAM-dependent methyltransferase [Xanthomonadaceae bacterium]
MSDERQDYEDQQTLWNGPAGRAWVEAQDVLDGMFQPFEDRLVGEVAADSRVLDVGCGTGSTTLAIARRLGPKGRSVGIDLSAPMLAVAQARARQEGVAADFIRADAQAHNFGPADFDLIVSRFGVMFFNDPVPAFANLRRAAKDGARLRFVAWRSAAENPFMTTAERAAAPILPELPARRPGAPGQFAFADRGQVQAILGASGWTSIDIRPVNVTCTLRERDLIRYLSWLGPVGAVLQRADEPGRRKVIETVSAAFAPYVSGAEVRFIAACWWVGARAS